ncbi:MAG: hypothetical protein ACTSYD_00895 [Candidatus Heimdallarchaeaceae archaeon]
MEQLLVPEHVFLKRLLTQLKRGENIEQALFNSNTLNSKVLIHLQLGRTIIDCLSMIQFKHQAIVTLLSTTSRNLSDETLKRIEATVRLIEKREEATKELQTVLATHQRRIRIIYIITVIIIGVLAGFSPIFLSLHKMISVAELASNINMTRNTSIALSFLLINILNSYFLLQIADDKRKATKIILTIFIHILLVLVIQLFLQKITLFL